MKKVRYITLRNVREKMNNEKGFTLIEMLIVVAIIAILVAVSIPMISSSLEKAKHSTDAANERAAKSEILIGYMSEAAAGGIDIEKNVVYYYDAKNGTVSDGSPTVEYGKHKEHQYIAIELTDDETVSMNWVGGTVGLCSDNPDNPSSH